MAGRNREKLLAFAANLDLHTITLSLAEQERLTNTVADYDLVVHLAGPFTQTSAPMVEACLQAGTHYVDVAGELEVFRQVYERHHDAIGRRIALIPGCGFDVIPNDCLAADLAARFTAQWPDPTFLELAIDPDTKLSAGTAKAAMEVIAQGGFVRKNGVLRAEPIGQSGPNVRFHQGERSTMVVPLADLESAWRTTEIPNIQTCLALPPGRSSVRRLASTATALMRITPLRRIMKGAIDLTLKNSKGSKQGTASIWGRVSDEHGNSVEGWMRTPEPYSYTTHAVLNVVEAISKKNLMGALTPAIAFGPDFALTVPGTERSDRFEL